MEWVLAGGSGVCRDAEAGGSTVLYTSQNKAPGSWTAGRTGQDKVREAGMLNILAIVPEKFQATNGF